MATFSLPLDGNSQAHQALRPGTTTNVTVAATANTSAALTTEVRIYRIWASVDAYIAVGANPTATANDMPLAGRTAEYIKLSPGDKISAIRSTTDGFLRITAMT